MEVGRSTRVEVRQSTNGVEVEKSANVGLGRVEVGQPTNIALGLPLGQSTNVALGLPSPVATFSGLSHWKLGEKDHGRTVKVKEVPIKLWNVRIERALKWEPLDYTVGVEVGGLLEDRPTVESGGGPPLAPLVVPTALLSDLHTKRHRALAAMRKHSQLKRQ